MTALLHEQIEEKVKAHLEEWAQTQPEEVRKSHRRLEVAELERARLQREAEYAEVERQNADEAEANEAFLRSLSSVKDKGRSRLAQLRRREERMQAELAAIKQRLSEYDAQEETERVAAFRSSATRPGAALNSPLQKLLDKRRKDEAALPKLKADLSALSVVIAEETTKQAKAALSEVRRRNRGFLEQEDAIWQRAVEQTVALRATYGELAAIAEERGQFYKRAKAALPELAPDLATDPIVFVPETLTEFVASSASRIQQSPSEARHSTELAQVCAVS
jgi:hypothetical protein